ncbi:MAG: hypothetical protein KGL44_12370 [Sphingomonadales bacterium]|nr:hypothetical protein [Sphingomonadales bacterium]
MARIVVGPLPADPLAAAAAFHGQVLPRVIGALTEARGTALLVFDPADYSHRSWRLAAVQSLARRCAHRRINAVEGTDEVALAAAERYLDAAGGVTGQLLPLDSHGAGEVVSSA